MRWSVEVTSEKADLQKYVVEAESWQRALQAARAQRGEQGPMSGFSIELLDEGYRAVDPVSRNKFVVKRAADDAALSIPPPGAVPAATKDSKAPAAPKPVSKAPAPLPSKTSVPPSAISTKSVPPAAKSVPPRPADKKEEKKEEKKKSRAERKSEKWKAAQAAKKVDEPKKTEIEPESVSEAKTEPTAPAPAKPDSVPPAPLLPIGAFVPGLPSVKLMASREQDPTDASPLTYREYAFSVKAGTAEDVAEKVLRAQLKIVAAHLEKLKQGKLVNLAVFDGEFTGKPAVPPLCTLAWKDWKGEPVIAFPRRGGTAAQQVQVKPPTPSQSPPAPTPQAPSVAPPAPPTVVMPPPSMPPPAPVMQVNMPPGYSAPPPAPSVPPANVGVSQMPRPPGALAAMLGAAKIGSDPKLPVAEPATTPSSPNPTMVDQAPPSQAPATAPNPFSAPPPAAANPFSSPPPAPGAPVGPSTSPMMPVAAPVASVPPPAPVASVPPPANPFAPTASLPPPAGSLPPPAGSLPPPAGSFPPPAGSFPPPAGVGSIPPAAAFNPVVVHQSSPPAGRRSSPSYAPEGTVRTPSGRFVRGRVTGDELITQLFESMHDLHFLRDALDGGQFCLALAMEMIPVRAAVIHFFDVEKREWIVACTRGKDAGKLLTTRTPETDDFLRAAARHRRAIVTPSASHAQAQRYQSIGGAKSIIIAPIMQAGRALGAMEMINPADGMPFNEDEGNAMTYIAEQYAEYLGSRGIVVQVDRIRAASS